MCSIRSTSCPRCRLPHRARRRAVICERIADSPDPADRTLHYCAYYENGLGEDGSPDPTTVKRRSKTPPNALNVCEPVACTAGRVGEACGGPDDQAACDSSPGAGDGECDACVATGGNSTEDEM